MKNKLILFSFVLVWLSGLNVSAANGIEFIHDKKFQELLDMAKAQNKLLFIDCYTSWCGPCKRLAANTFPDSAVGEFFNTAFINTKFDMEKDEGITIAGKYGVKAYPTMLWLDGDGEVKFKLVGGVDPRTLIEQGRKAVDPTPGILNGMKKEYEGGKRDVDFLSDYLNTLYGAGEKYDPEFKEYLGKLSVGNLHDKKHIQTIFNLTDDMKSPGLAYLEKDKSTFKDVVGAEAFDKKIEQLATKAEQAAPRANNKKIFDDAIELVKSNKAPNKEELTLRLSMDYYQQMGDWENYDKATSRYIKKYGAKNAGLLNDAAWNYFINVLNPELVKKATAWAYEAINIDNKYTYNLTYAYLLYKQNNYKEAERACDYAILRAKDENVKATSADALKANIKKSVTGEPK